MDPQYLRDAYEIGQELEDARYIIACLRAELSAFEKQRSEAAKKFVIACTDRPDDWTLFYESDAVTPAVTIGDLRCLLDLVSRADAAVAEAKALREALFTIKRGHTDGDLGGATWRPLHQNEIKAIVDRATLAQPADGGK